MPSPNPDLTATLKLPSPTPPDPPDIPGDIKALTERLEELLARQFAESHRSASASAGAHQDIPVSASVTISGAKAGVYAITASGSAERTGTGGTRHVITIVVGGTDAAKVDRDVTEDGPYNFAIATLVEHTGGNLTVGAHVNTGNTAGLVRDDSRLSVARVSP